MTMNKHLEGTMNVFQMWICKIMGNISGKEKQTIKEVFEKLGMMKELLQDMKIKQINIFNKQRDITH
uniref:Uncharacterized protein n=1 Tax=Arion vulgaris TaxID=1028688 RepID=A0A0B7A8E1_9EUPU